MKLFEVVYEEEMTRRKEPGGRSTELQLVSSYFAAESIDQVWAEVARLRTDPERTLIKVAQLTHSCTVLPPESEEASR